MSSHNREDYSDMLRSPIKELTAAGTVRESHTLPLTVCAAKVVKLFWTANHNSDVFLRRKCPCDELCLSVNWHDDNGCCFMQIIKCNFMNCIKIGLFLCKS